MQQQRIFKYKEHTFTDIDPALTPEQVRRALVAHFPGLATATTEEKVRPDGVVEITFVEQVGQKG